MKTIYFKILYNANKEIYQTGYVEVSEDVEEPEWFYYDQNGFAQPRAFTHHDGIGISQIGATDEQEMELDLFYNAVYDEVIFINDVILLAEEEENRTYVRNDITIIVNDGAKFELDYEDYESNEWGSDYYMAFTPKFNGKNVLLNEEVYFQDPYTYEHFKISDMLYENGAYIVEIPKSYWEYPEMKLDYCNLTVAEDTIQQYTTAFKRAYAHTLSKELGLYSKYGENAEQLFEECDINQIGLVTDDSLNDFLIKEGII